MISDFGIWAGIAAFIEWFSIFLFVASIARFVPRNSFTKRQLKDPLDHEIKPGFRNVFLGLSFLAFVSGLAAVFFLNYNFNIYYDFPQKHPLRQAANFFKDSRNWSSILEVSFPSGVDLGKVAQFTETARMIGNVLKIESASGTLNYLTKNYDKLTQELIQREFKHSDLGKRYFADDGIQVALVYLKESWLSDIKRAKDALTKICEPYSCVVVGGPVILLDYSSKVSQTVISSFSLSAISLAAVLLYLCAIYGQMNSFLYLLYSSMWSPVVIVGLLALFQVPINFITSIVVSVIVGLTGDNAIQFLYRSRNKNLRRGISESRGASLRFLMMAIVPSLAYLTFILNSEKLLGISLIVGFILCWIGDVLILKSLVEKGRNP
jgi:predicted RND superfamily exporter protein